MTTPLSFMRLGGGEGFPRQQDSIARNIDSPTIERPVPIDTAYAEPGLAGQLPPRLTQSQDASPRGAAEEVPLQPVHSLATGAFPDNP